MQLAVCYFTHNIDYCPLIELQIPFQKCLKRCFLWRYSFPWFEDQFPLCSPWLRARFVCKQILLCCSNRDLTDISLLNIAYKGYTILTFQMKFPERFLQKLHSWSQLAFSLVVKLASCESTEGIFLVCSETKSTECMYSLPFKPLFICPNQLLYLESYVLVKYWIFHLRIMIDWESGLAQGWCYLLVVSLADDICFLIKGHNYLRL